MAVEERYVPSEVRTGIERTYYSHTSAKATFDHVARDAAFRDDPASHPALYTDHGPAHARDVARQVLRVLDIANGLLIPRRSGARLEFMRGYAEMLAYVHDIGMVDNTQFGRKMHAEYATQEVFNTKFDPWIDSIWYENSGNIASRLLDLNHRGAIEQNPRRVLREMLSMANSHSKSKVPVAVVNDPPALRQSMLLALGLDLRALRLKQRKDRVALKALSAERTGGLDPTTSPNATGQGHSRDFVQESFAWLTADNDDTRDLVSDVVDTLRALRCADALRQRGNALRTSGGYTIVLDRLMGIAFCFLRSTRGESMSVEVKSMVSGEANIASCELTSDGDLRVAFLCERFPDDQIMRRAAHNAALAINDIQLDAIESFSRTSTSPADSLKSSSEMRIQLDGTSWDQPFVYFVREALDRVNPTAAHRVTICPSPQNASNSAQRIQGHSTPSLWDPAKRKQAARLLAAA